MGYSLSPLLYGFAIGSQKVGKIFNFKCSEDWKIYLKIIEIACENLCYSEASVSFMDAYKDRTKTGGLSRIIAFNDESTKQELKDRPMEPVYPNVEEFMRILTGPHIWHCQTS